MKKYALRLTILRQNCKLACKERPSTRIFRDPRVKHITAKELWKRQKQNKQNSGAQSDSETLLQRAVSSRGSIGILHFFQRKQVSAANPNPNAVAKTRTLLYTPAECPGP